MDNTQLLKGVLPTAVLATIARGHVYGYSILRALRAAGFSDVGDASVYGTLQRLFSEGRVSAYMDQSERGPARKCYSLTLDGEQMLRTGRESWSRFEESVNTVVMGWKESGRDG